ncbi:MAG: ATP-dependent RNA helicase HrpA [Pirellulales bacterium]
MSSTPETELLARVLQRDRHRLQVAGRKLHDAPIDDPRRIRWLAELEESAAIVSKREAAVPQLNYDAELPITARREEIIELLKSRSVLVICGETGSGKSTQLPKICLEAGFGRRGLIGHTQPRRLAARAVATRVAEELGSRVGERVGFKIRFTDKTAPETLVKVMTDGVLLAETQSDRFLDQYEVLIIDEAHERSLNIDFLLAYLKNILVKRPDLKLIITSATIDPQRFAEHFADEHGPAPILEVSGRTYPVEVRYREPDEELSSASGDDEWQPTDGTPLSALGNAVEEVLGEGEGDVLVFLPTERDIRLAARMLRGRFTAAGRQRAIEILPLYARLSEAEQNRIFQSHSGRRVVLSTNVAESSLTVPNIHFVIDTGTARISRYAPRQRVQRLPIEAVSQASADQRAGRCGRLGPGICVRLYSEEDYRSRTRFTTPEIRRSDLAAVILQCLMLRLGPLLELPLLDPPSPDAVRDGQRTLHEIGALDARGGLTEIGRQLGRLPCDPRVGRMLLEGHERGVLGDVLVIAASLESQDVRLRPAGKQAAADEAHAEFKDIHSDFLSLLRLWHFYEHLRSNLSRSKLSKALEQRYLSLQRFREWSDIVRQLKEMLASAGMKVGAPHTPLPPIAVIKAPAQPDPQPHLEADRSRGKGGKGKQDGRSPSSQQVSIRRPLQLPAKQPPTPRPAGYDAIHQSLLTGLLSGCATAGDNHLYQSTHGSSFFLWPGSGLFQRKPKWIVAAEVLETTKRYGRTAAEIDPTWLETLAAPLLKHSYSDPHWSRKAQAAMVYRRSTLYGLPIVDRRAVLLAPIEPTAAREMFIRHALVQGEAEMREKFYLDNAAELNRLQELAEKTRKREWLVDPYRVERFYHERLPAEVVDLVSLRKWLKSNSGTDADKQLRFTAQDILDTDVHEPALDAFPHQLKIGPTQLPLAYRFHPGDAADGVTVTVPQAALRQVSDEALGWLVPGLLEEKLLHMIRSLPKHLRTSFVPAPDSARKLAQQLHREPKDVPFTTAVCRLMTQHAGEVIEPKDFEWDKLPEHLRIRVNVVDDHGKTVDASRDVKQLQSQLAAETAQIEMVEAPSALAQAWSGRRVTTVDFQEIPASITIRRGGIKVAAFPALVDEGDAVSLQLLDNAGDALKQTQSGWLRLFAIKFRRELNSHVTHLPGFDKSAVMLSRLVPGGAIKDHLRDLLARIAFIDNEATLTGVDDFVVRQMDSARRLSMAAQDLAGWLPKLAEHYQAVRLAIESAPAPWREVAVDIRTQVDSLTAAGFMTHTAWPHLREFPRYLQGAKVRWDKLRTGVVPKDKNLREPIDRLLARLSTASGQPTSTAVHDLAPEWIDIRYQIEELRVSVFAQQLGTRQSVSVKRIEEALAKAKPQ